VSVEKRRKVLKNRNAENQPLMKKMQKILKKLLKNLVSPKKSSTFAADFATNASER